MPFDPYALCPGGRDKKIRFCCPDMLKELEQVIKLLESGQPSACLSYVETLEKTHPNCACLTKAKLSIYRAENRWDEALPVAEQFYALEPDNPTAAAEYALALIVTGNAKLAISVLVDAFERMQADTVHSALLQAALQVATYSLLGGLVMPAIAIGHVLKEIPAISEKAHRLLFRATSESRIPLLLRDWSFDYDCPDDFPGKETFEEAAVLVRLLRWKQALALLKPLTEHADSWSGIWRNIATIHLWFLDQEEARKALKTYASLPNTPMEDAVDAEVVRLLLSPDTLGDQTHLLTVEYTITDADKALEILLSIPQFHCFDANDFQTTPPPRGGCFIFDRPLPDSDTTLTLENIPSHQAFALLFGKETDREARLLIMAMLACNRESVETTVCEALGDLIHSPGTIIEQMSISKSRSLLECRYFIPQDQRADSESFKKLISDHYSTNFIESWLALPLGLLDGKTPSEAAQEAKYTIPLLAAIRMIEHWGSDIGIAGNADTLRSRLGLPTLDAITIEETSDEDAPLALDAYPVWRWHRFDASKLSTEVLTEGLQIVAGMRELRTAAKFAEELLSRPMDAMEFSVRFMAFEAVISAAQNGGNFEQALLWVERAKSESVAQNVPDAAWYLHEISLGLMLGKAEITGNAIKYLWKHYRDDEVVMGSLRELLAQLGMLNSDGTPTAMWMQTLTQMQKEEARAEERKIWTPDSELPGGSAAPSKLWVPD